MCQKTRKFLDPDFTPPEPSSSQISLCASEMGTQTIWGHINPSPQNLWNKSGGKEPLEHRSEEKRTWAAAQEVPGWSLGAGNARVSLHTPVRSCSRAWWETLNEDRD